MGKQILGPWMAARISITVRLQIDSSDYGQMWYTYSPKIRDFEILINQNVGRERFIKTMAHEMTHVRQYARRELKEYKNHINWCGRKINIIKMAKDNTEVSVVQSTYGKMRTYENFPWEIDAENNAEIMYNRYIKETETEQ